MFDSGKVAASCLFFFGRDVTCVGHITPMSRAYGQGLLAVLQQWMVADVARLVMDYAMFPLFVGHTSSVHTVRVSQDGKYLFTAGDDHQICQWFIQGRKLTASWTCRHVKQLIIEPTARHFWTLSEGGYLHRWSVDCEDWIMRIEMPNVQFMTWCRNQLYFWCNRQIWSSHPDSLSNIVHHISDCNANVASAQPIVVSADGHWLCWIEEYPFYLTSYSFIRTTQSSIALLSPIKAIAPYRNDQILVATERNVYIIAPQFAHPEYSVQSHIILHSFPAFPAVVPFRHSDIPRVIQASSLDNQCILVISTNGLVSVRFHDRVVLTVQVPDCWLDFCFDIFEQNLFLACGHDVILCPSLDSRISCMLDVYQSK